MQLSALARESRKMSDSVKCPSCTDMGLSIIEIHGIELDVCGNCTGVFFDIGELESLRKRIKKDDDEEGITEHLAAEGLFWLISAFLGGS